MQTGKHLLRTQNVSEQNQKHFLCPGHKICVRNKCCARGQTGKHLCRQQCVRNNVSSFARAFKTISVQPPSFSCAERNVNYRSLVRTYLTTFCLKLYQVWCLKSEYLNLLHERSASALGFTSSVSTLMPFWPTSRF